MYVTSVSPTVLPFSFGEDEYHTSGSHVQTMCVMGKGDLPAEITWAFYGKDTSTMGMTTTRLGQRSSILQIDSITAAHSGDYTCTVKNLVGSQNYTTVLKVFGTIWLHLSLSYIPTRTFIPPPKENKAVTLYYFEFFINTTSSEIRLGYTWQYK